MQAKIFVLLVCVAAIAPQQFRGQATPVAPRGAPAAASTQERDDYHAALAPANGAATEKSAHEFAAKYPHSDLRRYLYQKALRQYQAENDPAGMLSAAKEVLAIDPSDPLALVLTATVLSDEFSPGDPDRDKKIAEIRGDAEAAIHNLDHGVLPASATRQQGAVYRSTLQAMAYSALGIAKLKAGDDAGAEKDLKTAAEMTKARPDPYIWYHLALAQDHRGRFSSAINSVEQAMQLASANPQLQRLAEREHDRLLRMAGRKQSSSERGEAQPPK